MLDKLFYQKDSMGILTYIVSDSIENASLKTGFPISSLHLVTSVYVDPAQIVAPAPAPAPAPAATVPPTV